MTFFRRPLTFPGGAPFVQQNVPPGSAQGEAAAIVPAMERVLECPQCGAPLSPEGAAEIVECFYCKRHVVVRSGAPTEEPAAAVAKSPSPARKPKSAKREKLQLWQWLAIAAVVPLTLAAIYYELKPPAAPEGPRTEELVKQLELSATPQQAGALLGERANAPGRVTVDFPGGHGTINRLELDRQLGGEISEVGAYFGPDLNKAAFVSRLQQAAPNRTKDSNGTVRVYLGDTVLDVGNGTFKLWHWSSVHPPNTDYTHCSARLSAYWALLRWAALDGKPLTAEQQKLVNGPRLDELSALDLSLTVEQATDAFQKKFTAGFCRMQAGLTCLADVDHALVNEVRFQWPNALRARPQQVVMTFKQRSEMDKAQRALAGCLHPVLGPGEEKVVDYVRGTRTFEWDLGAGGDRVVVDTSGLTLSAGEKSPVDQAAAWHSRFAQVAAAVERCAL